MGTIQRPRQPDWGLNHFRGTPDGSTIVAATRKALDLLWEYFWQDAASRPYFTQGGQATVTGAGTTATLTLGTTEADTSYQVMAVPVSSTGAPATGSNRILTVAKNAGSVVLTVEAAPGGVTTVTFDVALYRLS